MAQLTCSNCEATYALDDPRWKCDCGHFLDIEYEPVFDPKKIESKKPTLWRYREALPIKRDENIMTFDEGFTPLTEILIDGKPVLIKQDHLFSTGSFKDRGASVLISKVKELGIPNVVEDSSGNAGCAIAAYCAKAAVDCEIFVPADTAAGKVAQIRAYGARLTRIPGTREDTADAVLRAAKEHYYASHSWNPFFLHGTKTFAFEICEQLGWRAPDSIVLPVGNGTLLLGADIGFRELLQAGITDTLPRIIAVQSISCAPLYKAFKENLEIMPKIEKGETIAEGIAIAEPIRGIQIIDAVKDSGGEFIAVNEVEIENSLREMWTKGFYIEPTSAATTAGVRAYLEEAGANENIVSVFTGHGLKSIEKTMKILKN